MQHAGHFAQVNGVAGQVDAHGQRQRHLAQLNESTWQRIGEYNIALDTFSANQCLQALSTS